MYIEDIIQIIFANSQHAVDMCGVEAKRRTSDLNVTGTHPPLATRYIRDYTLCC